MDNIKFDHFKPTETVVSCLQLTPKGESPSKTLRPGHISGFSDYFRDASGKLSSMYIGLTGNHRTEVISSLRKKAEQARMEQHVTEIKIRLFRTFRERINGITENGLPSDEYELIKATTPLRAKLVDAWSNVISKCPQFDTQKKIDLLSAAMTGDVSKFIPISSILFSKVVEEMPYEFRNARAIIFPAYPIAYSEWKGNPARLIAFDADAIV